MTAADRPSVTDNARAEAVRIIDSSVPDDVPGYRIRYAEKAADALIERGLLVAGRAETTTALPRPGDGCQCTWHNEDRGGGHYELVAEYEPACPEHSEHVWNPCTGMWEHRAETTTDEVYEAGYKSGYHDGYPAGYGAARAETTTATTEDAVERVFQTTHPAPNTVMGWIRAGYEAGLLATARTRPTRQQLIDALVMSPLSDTAGTDMRPFEQTADAVLALLADQPAPADVWDEAVEKIREQHPVCEDPCEMCAEMDDWLTALADNPYRGGERDE